MKSSRRDKFKNQTEYKVEYWNLLSVTLQKQINNTIITVNTFIHSFSILCQFAYPYLLHYSRFLVFWQNTYLHPLDNRLSVLRK